MLPAGYPPQLLFSSRPDAVVHFPRSFVALLPFCLSAFPVRAPHSLPPVSQLFPSARRTAFLRFLSFSRPHAAQPSSGFSAFPVRLALAVSRFPVCLSYVHKKSSPQGAENQNLTQNSAHQAYFAKSF